MSKLIIDPEVSNAFQRLTQEDNEISWITCGYPEGKSNNLVLVGEGTGGMPEFVSKLPISDVIWGAFKVVGVDDRGNLISRRPKYIFVKYLPSSNIPPMKRARAVGHKGDIKTVLQCHIDIEIDNPADLTEEIVIAKLRASGGAHQPTSYEFHSYSK